MTKLTRIEEVKKILGQDFNEVRNYDDGQVIRGWNYSLTSETQDRFARQIDKYYSQLFPQPLDDKELEKAKLTDEEMGYAVLSVAVEDQWCFRGDTLKGNLPSYRAIANTATDKALALLQPKIEEAKREERERILKLLPEITTRFDHNRTCFDCVVTIKRQALKKVK